MVAVGGAILGGELGGVIGGLLDAGAAVAGGAIITGIGYAVAKLVGQSGSISSASTQAAQAQLGSWGAAGAASFANTLVSLAQAGQGMLSAIQGAYLDTAGEFEKLFSEYLPQLRTWALQQDEAAAGYAIQQANDWTDATSEQTNAALRDDVDALNQSIFANRVSAHMEALGDYESAIGQLAADKSQLQLQIAFTGEQAATYTDLQVGQAREAATAQVGAEATARMGAVSNAEAVAAAATAAVATDLANWLKSCGDNLCSGLSGLASVLPDVTNLFIDGVLFAFLAEAIRDPSGQATDTIGVLTPLASQGESMLSSLLGI